MPLCQCNFYSKVLEHCVNIQVYLPAPKRTAMAGMELDEIYPKDRKYPVLYLLHGMYEDESIWVRKSNVERYAEEKQVALVMPGAQNSYYTDMAWGPNYFTYLTEELPRIARAYFPLSDKREDQFIAGLSMGGYGALKSAFTRPDLYAAAASFSGAVDIGMVADYIRTEQERLLFECVFGDPKQFAGSSADLFALVKSRKQEGADLPRLFISCGTEDALCYPMNRALRNCLEEEQVPFVYEEGPGAHEWDFWDRSVKRFLDWLMERGLIQPQPSPEA